jgi:hypothetical protein
VTDISNIKQILTVGRAKGIHWDSDMIVPLNKMIYNTETRIIKKGNGNDFLEDLAIYLDLNNLDDIAIFYNEVFPQLNDSINNGFLLTDDTNGFQIYQEFSVEDIIDKQELFNTLEFYADVGHEHVSIDIHGLGTAALHAVGLKPNEIPVLSSNNKLDKNIIPPNVSLNDKDSDIISYLLLGRLSKETISQDIMPRGIIDEFNDLSQIDIYSSGEYLHTDSYIEKDGNNFYLVSLPFEKESNITPIYIFVRGTKNLGLLNKDIIFEVSNDNINWYQVILNNIPMVTSSINCFSGIVNLGETRKYEDITIANGQIEDIKENISSFTVDIINNAGHFNNPINDKIKPGYAIYTENNGLVVIRSIVGDGTELNSVIFQGTLPVDTYTNIMISPCLVNKNNNGLSLSGIKDSNENIYTLIEEYGTSVIDLTTYQWRHIFSKNIAGELNGINYSLIFGYDDNSFVHYNYDIGIYEEIVRKENNQWEYYDFSNNIWINYNKPLPNVISKAFSANQINSNDILNIANIPMIRKEKQLTKLAIVMKNPADNQPTALNGITTLGIDGISYNSDISAGTSMRWRCRQLNDSNFDIHGIRIRY